MLACLYLRAFLTYGKFFDANLLVGTSLRVVIDTRNWRLKIHCTLALKMLKMRNSKRKITWLKWNKRNRFSCVVSHKEYCTHIFKCSQFGKFESKCKLVFFYVLFWRTFKSCLTQICLWHLTAGHWTRLIDIWKYIVLSTLKIWGCQEP